MDQKQTQRPHTATPPQRPTTQYAQEQMYDRPLAPSQGATLDHRPKAVTSGDDEKPSPVKSIATTVGLFLGALFFAFCINTFVFQSYEVDGSSMQPTLQNKNRLIIWKAPVTLSSIFRNEYTPNRHDIIVFKKPGFEEQEQLIKRVIGLPGERVVLKDKHFTIYNKDYPEGFDPDINTDYGDLIPKAQEQFVDVQVGADELFVSGDNRQPGGSLDSRTSLGNVPLDHVVGKLVLRLYPLSEISIF